MRKAIRIFGLVLILTSCDKSPTYHEIQEFQYGEVLKNLALDCNQVGTSMNYAIATIRGDSTCYYDGSDGYYFQPGFSATYITTSPTLNISSSGVKKSFSLSFRPGNEPFKEIFEIRFVGFHDTLSYTEIAESIFRIGLIPIVYAEDGLPISLSNEHGVEISMISRYQKPGSDGLAGYWISSKMGIQPPESQLEIAEVSKTEYLNEIQYSIILKFECLLFHDGRLDANQIFGELEDGIMSVSFAVPKGY